MISAAETKGRQMVQSPVQLQSFRHNETGMVMMRANSDVPMPARFMA